MLKIALICHTLRAMLLIIKVNSCVYLHSFCVCNKYQVMIYFNQNNCKFVLTNFAFRCLVLIALLYINLALGNMVTCGFHRNSRHLIHLEHADAPRDVEIYFSMTWTGFDITKFSLFICMSISNAIHTKLFPNNYAGLKQCKIGTESTSLLSQYRNH